MSAVAWNWQAFALAFISGMSTAIGKWALIKGSEFFWPRQITTYIRRANNIILARKLIYIIFLLHYIINNQT
jgi:hypothetical protein